MLILLLYSIRVFSIAAIICMFLVLPVNYYGQDMTHKMIPSESIDVFCIENVKENSKWYEMLERHTISIQSVMSLTLTLDFVSPQSGFVPTVSLYTSYAAPHVCSFTL